MNYLELIRDAIKNILSNKLRTFLTMLGIIIGITSVIIISSLGMGGKKTISDSLNRSLNTGRVIMSPKEDVKVKSKDHFKEIDYSLLKGIPNVINLSLTTSAYSRIRIKKRRKHLSLISGNRYLPKIKQLKLINGRDFNLQDETQFRKVILIDHVLAKEYFKNKDPIGKPISINIRRRGNNINERFIVVGVYHNELENLAALGQSIYGGFILNESFEKYIGKPDYKELIFSMENSSLKSDTENLIITIVENNRKNKDIYATDDSTDQTEDNQKVLNLMTLFISLVASISLIVGGIGVMNMMLATVTERTKEIGIRKALGAQPKDILNQFLFEAITITFISGSIGVVLGLLITFIIGKLINIPPLVNILHVLSALFISVIIGIIFGVMPAKKASKLDPIESLHYE